MLLRLPWPFPGLLFNLLGRTLADFRLAAFYHLFLYEMFAHYAGCGFFLPSGYPFPTTAQSWFPHKHGIPKKGARAVHPYVMAGPNCHVPESTQEVQHQFPPARMPPLTGVTWFFAPPPAPLQGCLPASSKVLQPSVLTIYLVQGIFGIYGRTFWMVKP